MDWAADGPGGSNGSIGGAELVLDKSTGVVKTTQYYAFDGRTVAVRTEDGYDDLWLVTADRHGTGQVQINAQTQEAVIRRQGPFGGPRGELVDTDPNADPAWSGTRGFVDGVQDPTGLTHLGAREYDPTIGSFISVDPIIDLADPTQMGGYNYGNHSPMVNADPTGMIFHSGSGRFTGSGTVVTAGGRKSKQRSYQPWRSSGEARNFIPDHQITRSRGTSNQSKARARNRMADIRARRGGRGESPTTRQLVQRWSGASSLWVGRLSCVNGRTKKPDRRPLTQILSVDANAAGRFGTFVYGRSRWLALLIHHPQGLS